MKLSEIDERTFSRLDESCQGVLRTLRDHCIEHGREALITVQTHIEGLEKGEMKLFFQIVGNGETIDYAVAKVYGSIQTIGWNIYLHNTLTSARSYLDRALSKIEV